MEIYFGFQRWFSVHGSRFSVEHPLPNRELRTENRERRRRFLVAIAVAALHCLPTQATAEETSADLAILPSSVELHGSASSQRILLEWLSDGGTAVGPVEDPVTWQVLDSSVARTENGRVFPVADGETFLQAQLGDRDVRVPVHVAGMPEPANWEFSRHVLPVLSKVGCNQGSCHGALAGKGGFRLSLRGYDAFGDHFNITQESRGRRVEPAEPGRSLFLAKPTGAIAHKGGLRLDFEDRNYQVLSEWLLQGAAAPSHDDPVLKRVEVLPAEMQLGLEQRQPLIVRAHYSDGRVEDVTQWATYTSAQEPVAEVDEHGLVRVVGHGEGAISVWFSSQIVVARISSPYPHELDDSVFQEASRSSFIDEIVLEKLQQLRLEPSARCRDEVFLRRAFLDTVGILPTTEETLGFLNDTQPDKRWRLVDDLLSRPEFTDYWAYRWSDILAISGRRLKPRAVKAYYKWIHNHVEKNTPWDEVVREVITARGDSLDQGQTNFYSLHQTPEDMAENISQAFLGLSINCAKCHNHPLEKWTNNQYYAMANLFARVRTKGWFGDEGDGEGLITLTVQQRGDLMQPLTGKPQPPTPLDGEPLDFDDPSDRREHLADWLTAPENPYFARSIANRIWASLFGRGIVEPVDNLRISNPASNEKLLTAIADFLIRHNFDLKQLIREILISETYQRASDPLPTNRDDHRFFARHYPRRLMAEPLLDAIAQVTKVPGEFTKIRLDGNSVSDTSEYPVGTRALQLFDSAVESSFLDTFGRNRREIVCECGRSNTPTMVQVLHIHNGDTINSRLQAEKGWIAELVAAELDDRTLMTQAYLRVLSRYPTSEEREDWTTELAGLSDLPRRELLEDVYWSLMSSREFLFQH